METIEKINVRGSMNELEIGGELELERGLYFPASVRGTATSLSENTGKKFSVSVQLEKIVVTRVS